MNLRGEGGREGERAFWTRMFQHNFCPPLLISPDDEAHFEFNGAGPADPACLPVGYPVTCRFFLLSGHCEAA